jgi:hypothetical protein
MPLVESPLLQPNEVAELVGIVKAGTHVVGLDLDAPSYAQFELQRVEALTPEEVLARTGGRTCAPGVYVRVRNKSSSPAVFRAQVTASIDTVALAREIGNAVDQAWRGARGPASR